MEDPGIREPDDRRPNELEGATAADDDGGGEPTVPTAEPEPEPADDGEVERADQLGTSRPAGVPSTSASLLSWMLALALVPLLLLSLLAARQRVGPSHRAGALAAPPPRIRERSRALWSRAVSGFAALAPPGSRTMSPGHAAEGPVTQRPVGRTAPEPTATDLRSQRILTSRTESVANSRLQSAFRMAAIGFPALPIGAAVVSFALHGRSAVAALARPPSWGLLLLAVAAVALGSRWIQALPRADTRLLRDRAQALDERRDWLDQVTHTLDRAVEHAGAGADGGRALRAATPEYVAHPVRQALDLGVAADRPPRGLESCSLPAFVERLDRTTEPDEAQRLLLRGSAYLHQRYRADVEMSVRLTGVRMVAPLLICFVPATALVIAAVRSGIAGT